MRITYDKNAKAVYIYISDKKVGESQPAGENVFLDYALDPTVLEPVGIEILNVEEIPIVEEI